MSKNEKPTAKKNDPKSKKDGNRRRSTHIHNNFRTSKKKFNPPKQNRKSKFNRLHNRHHPPKHNNKTQNLQRNPRKNNQQQLHNLQLPPKTTNKPRNRKLVLQTHKSELLQRHRDAHVDRTCCDISPDKQRGVFLRRKQHKNVLQVSHRALERFDRRQRPSRREIRGRRGAARNLRDIYHQQRLLGERQRERRLSRAEHVLSPFALHSARVQLR